VAREKQVGEILANRCAAVAGTITLTLLNEPKVNPNPELERGPTISAGMPDAANMFL
jgi:hypothetical protein